MCVKWVEGPRPPSQTLGGSGGAPPAPYVSYIILTLFVNTASKLYRIFWRFREHLLRAQPISHGRAHETGDGVALSQRPASLSYRVSWLALALGCHTFTRKSAALCSHLPMAQPS